MKLVGEAGFPSDSITPDRFILPDKYKPLLPLVRYGPLRCYQIELPRGY